VIIFSRLAMAATVAILTGCIFHSNKRSFPDTSTRIAVLTDQLPGGMSEAQIRFAATHYVGTQKLTLNLSRSLRAINPRFLVLHYHLAMWQSAPNVAFITEGNTWGNDYAAVNAHESWFWHNREHQRVTSSYDGKLLMNVSDPGFREHWRDSLIRQVEDGDYDAVFLDSASPALLQGEARSPADPRLFADGVRTNTFDELDGRSWIAAWEDWIADLDRALSMKGIPLIPNIGSLVTTWDNTDYSLATGAFSEGFLDPGFSTADWKAAADQTLGLVRRNKIVILQNYLPSPGDVARRRFLLASYLLVKDVRTYVAYFAAGPFEWYPEWDLDLGAAQKTAVTTDDLSWNGIYRRDFDKGVVLVNPGTSAVQVNLEAAFKRTEFVGGGAVSSEGTVAGRVETVPVTALEISAKGAEILLR
jgi:putative glycosyl hydrolase-like family 15 (GHL15) protein